MEISFYKKIFDVSAVHELASQTPEGLRDVTSEPSPVQEMMLIQTQVSEFISITLCSCISSTWLANRTVGVVLSRKGKQDMVLITFAIGDRAWKVVKSELWWRHLCFHGLLSSFFRNSISSH
jgi:hypothetical protein